MEKGRIIGIAVVLVFAAVVAYFFLSSETAKKEIPSYVTGEMREAYLWSNTSEGRTILEQLPCYCGCKYAGHKHTRHCFWRDNGDFDKHGVTCTVCFDIEQKARQMYEEGKDICTIRKEIDKFYEPNKHLATDTPMPEGCV